MASTTRETSFWVPGAVAPREPACARWQGKDTRRWVVHANGQRGTPSWDVELGAMNGGARVLLSSSTGEAYPTVQDQRQRALQLLVSLPSMQLRPRAELSEIMNAQDSSGWKDRHVTVDGKLVTASYWAVSSGEWCLTASAGSQLVQLAAQAVGASEIEVRPVDHWKAYGLDLGRPQTARALAEVAATVLPAWESTSDLTNHAPARRGAGR